MFKGGRPVHPIWKYFLRVTVDVILQHPPISPRRGPYHPQKKQIVPTQSDISSYITTTSVQDSIKIAKDRFKYVVTCIVNDNARNMDKMKEGAKEDDFSQIRWKSQLACIDTFIKNRNSYMNIVHEHEDDFDKQIARKIRDISIYDNARDLAPQLRPIAVALDKARSDSHSIADSCHICFHQHESNYMVKAVEKSGVPRDFVELALQLLSALVFQHPPRGFFQATETPWYLVTGSSDDFVIWINDD
ncbi:hypothetical protein LSH36_125g05000 [Paralvinella palmiformis]|uniref:Uncharacterized protein n=1 Tax=Paralvinella palmiformis TaxID=53620 RepID=A0AAD9JXG7_9ANNE|nr:hypothetical protein LSH36_125g05000 [Paralvinella palmiformis]